MILPTRMAPLPRSLAVTAALLLARGVGLIPDLLGAQPCTRGIIDANPSIVQTALDPGHGSDGTTGGACAGAVAGRPGAGAGQRGHPCDRSEQAQREILSYPVFPIWLKQVMR